MSHPTDLQDAVMQAFHTLNSVSVPFGAPFFGGYKTQWSAVYDHKNRTFYWRSHSNQDIQRIRLADMNIGPGGTEKHLLVNSSQLQWLNDASSLFEPGGNERM